MPDRAVDDLIAENERLQERVRELEWDVSTLKTERDAAIGAATMRLREAITTARDLVAQAYSDDEDNDSPGNMAFAVLNHALEARDV